jgi:hypothetical protein
VPGGCSRQGRPHLKIASHAGRGIIDGSNLPAGQGHDLAEIAEHRKDYERAQTLYQGSLALWCDIVSWREIARCLEGLVTVADLLGQVERQAMLDVAAKACGDRARALKSGTRRAGDIRIPSRLKD